MKPDLVDINIPKDHALVILERLKPFVDKMHHSQKMQMGFPDITTKFNLNELLISVYTQGLKDGIEVSKKVKLK